jgi:hypothetical protein
MYRYIVLLQIMSLVPIWFLMLWYTENFDTAIAASESKKLFYIALGDTLEQY